MKIETNDKLDKIESGKNVIKNDSINEEQFIKKCCISDNLFDKKFMIGTAISASIAVISVFVIMKIGMNYHDEKIQGLKENYESIETKIKGIGESILTLENSIKTINSDFKSSKDNSVYIYTSLANLQKSIDIIKKEIHIKTDNFEDSAKNLTSEKRIFIESFENLIKDGAPFESFLDSYSDKIDMKKYVSGSEILKFKNVNVKSINTLQKDFVSVGISAFEKSFDESFWEKQKRVIKEKIVDAIKIRKTDDKAESVAEALDDKTLFEKANQFILDGKTSESFTTLEKIKIEDNEFCKLKSEVKQRDELEKIFGKFKKEFIELESKK